MSLLFELVSLYAPVSYSPMFPGGIPPEFDGLASLEKLYLQENKLSGECRRNAATLCLIVHPALFYHLRYTCDTICSFQASVACIRRLLDYKSHETAGGLVLFLSPKRRIQS